MAEGPWDFFAQQQQSRAAPVDDGPWVVAQRMQMLEQPVVNAPGGVVNAVIAGLQSSSGGLILRGEAPDTNLNPDAAWYERAAFNVAGVVGDLPAMIVGGAAGSGLGPVGTGAGAFAVPSAIREALMTAYETGGVDTWEELWAVTKAGLTGGGKGAVIGGATFGAGKFVGGKLLGRATAAGPATRSTLTGVMAGKVGAEVTAMVTTGSALEGRMPTAQDFLDAAIVVGGLHAAVNVAGRLRNVYAKTGVPPEEVAMEAMKDPVLKKELMTEAYHGTPYDIGPEGFKLNKIGTGEGAQAFGWGLYFAEQKGVAGFYSRPSKSAAELDRLESLAELGPDALTKGEWKRLEQLRAENIPFQNENLYRVEIPKSATDNMLNWDLELRQHPEAVRKILEKIPGYEPGISGAAFYRKLVAQESAGTDFSRAMAQTRGVDPYSAEMSGLTTGELASSYLRSQGIPGIRYLDQLSRARDADRETFNFVVFDESLVRIVEKNGQPVQFDVPSKYQARAAEENAAAAVPDPKLVDRATAEQFRESPFAPIPQMKGEPTRPTHVNYEYLNTPEEVQGALSRLSQLYEEKIQAQRRGEVPNQQTVLEAKARLADVLGATGERVPGAASNAAELLARKQLAVGAAEELVARGKALAELGDLATPEQITQFLAQTERSAMILSEFLGARAETGRALQILKSTAKMSQKLEDMQKAIESYGGREGAIKLAETIGKAEDAAAALQAAKKAVEPTIGEKIIEVWKASILSGLTTHMANITGNTMSLAMSLPERAIAAAIGKMRGSQAGERVELAETHALGTGMVRGVMDGLKLAGETLMGRAPLSDKIDQPRGAIKGKAGEIVRIPFKALSAGDALFRTMAERGELYAQAVRAAHKEGLAPTTREFNVRVEEMVQNPTEAMLTAAKEAGDKGVFTTKLGKIGMHLQLATRGTPLEFVLPFIRTPANLLKWAAERIPGVNLLMESVRNDISGKNGKIAQDMAMARMVVGGVVATIVAAAVRDGSITGGGLSDPDKRRTMMAAGWQPYSIKIGDTYYSYARLDPLGRVMATVADTFEIIDAIEADDNDKLNVYGVVVAAIGNATVSQTYLSGLANAIGAITDPERYGGRWLDQYAASLVPSLIGQTAAAMDPQAREVNSVFDAIQNRIPIWREELLPKRNQLTGEPIEPTRAFPMAPITTTTGSKDKVLTEAARLGIRLPIAPKKVHVGKGTGKLGDVKITPEARNAYTEAQGKFAHQLLSQIVSSPGWDGMPDIVKEGIYSKVLRSARQQAALVALPPEARAVEIQRIANEIQGQLTR